MDSKSNGARRNNGKSRAMYGISRIDSNRFCTHAWRVKLTRRGVDHIKNFPDKRWDGKYKALPQTLRRSRSILDGQRWGQQLTLSIASSFGVKRLHQPRFVRRSGASGEHRVASI